MAHPGTFVEGNFSPGTLIPGKSTGKHDAASKNTKLKTDHGKLELQKTLPCIVACSFIPKVVCTFI